jgi:hypothetical protein
MNEVKVIGKAIGGDVNLNRVPLGIAKLSQI